MTDPTPDTQPAADEPAPLVLEYCEAISPFDGVRCRQVPGHVERGIANHLPVHGGRVWRDNPAEQHLADAQTLQDRIDHYARQGNDLLHAAIEALEEVTDPEESSGLWGDPTEVLEAIAAVRKILKKAEKLARDQQIIPG